MKKHGIIRAGIGGWTFEPWRGTFYPEGLAHAKELEYASAHLPTIEVNGLEIDLAAHVVRRDGEPIHLTPIEFDLLRVLARNRGRLMTHRKLLAEVWGPEYVDDIQPLRTHIARLRAKIEPEGAGGPRYIVTDPGVGYRFSL